MNQDKLRVRLMEMIEDGYSGLKPETKVAMEAEKANAIQRLNEADQFHFVVRYPRCAKMLMVMKLVKVDEIERLMVRWFNVDGELVSQLNDYSIGGPDVTIGGRAQVWTENGNLYVKGKTWNELSFNRVRNTDWIDVLTGGPKDG